MSKGTVCLTIDNKIKLIALLMQGETPATTKNLISAYWVANKIDGTSQDVQYPSVEELSAFRDGIRASNRVSESIGLGFYNQKYDRQKGSFSFAYNSSLGNTLIRVTRNGMTFFVKDSNSNTYTKADREQLNSLTLELLSQMDPSLLNSLTDFSTSGMRKEGYREAQEKYFPNISNFIPGVITKTTEETVLNTKNTKIGFQSYSKKTAAKKAVEDSDVTISFNSVGDNSDFFLNTVDPDIKGKKVIKGAYNPLGLGSVSLEKRAEMISTESKRIAKMINDRGINFEDGITLNIDGSNINKILNASLEDIDTFMIDLLSQLSINGVKVNTIISSGVSGISESAIKAASNLDIHLDIRVPKDGNYARKKSTEEEEKDSFGRNIKKSGDKYTIEEYFSRFSNRPEILASKAKGIEISEEQYDKRFGKENSEAIFDSESDAVVINLERELLNKSFTARERTLTVNLLANLFSSHIDSSLNALIGVLNNQLEEALESGSEAEALNILKTIENYSREKAIKIATPKLIFLSVRESLQEFLDISHELRYALVADEMRLREYDLTEEEFDLMVSVYTDNRIDYYQRILDNFNQLAFETTRILSSTEGIKFTSKESSYSDVNTQEFYESHLDLIGSEENIKEAWMTEFKQLSAASSLSQEVRKLLTKIERKTAKGDPVLDVMGYTLKYDASYIHSSLLDAFIYMSDVEDMMTILLNLQATKPWVKQILDMFLKEEGPNLTEELIASNEEKDILKSKFYKNYNKDLNTYYIQRSKLDGNGVKVTRNIPVNKPNGIYALLSLWRDNYESGNIISEDSVYDRNSNINLANVVSGLLRARDLLAETVLLENDEFVEKIFEDDEFLFNEIWDLLEAVGVQVNGDLLEIILTDSSNKDNITKAKNLIDKLNVIFEGLNNLKHNKALDSTSQENSESGEYDFDLLNNFDSAYSEIAKVVEAFNLTAFEFSFRESGKSYYSFTSPNFIKKTFNMLHSKERNEEKWLKYIEDNYGKYEWFKRSSDGKIMNDYLNDFIEGDTQGLFEHKVLLNRDKIEYSSQSSPEYLQAIFAEYLSDLNADKNVNSAKAFYHIPIMSDAGTSEFFSAKRYHRAAKYELNGDIVNYRQVIISKLMNVFELESGRMFDVATTFVNRIKGIETQPLVDNFDISLSPSALSDIAKDNILKAYETGEVGTLIQTIQEEFKKHNPLKYSKNIAGAEFKFLADLNGFQDIYTILNDITKGENTGNSIIELLNAITEVMLKTVSQDIELFKNRGLFKTSEKGYLINFPGVKSDKIENKSLIEALKYLKKLDFFSGAEFEDLHGPINDFLDVFEKEGMYNMENAELILEILRDTLDETILSNTLIVDFIKLYEGDLYYTSEAQSIAEEYIYNSVFATSLIVQLLATDYAYFKGPQDFQKRFKMYYSPAEKLNTDSKYGRKTERSIYLSDLVIKAPTYTLIEQIFDKALKDGRINSSLKAEILKAYTEVEVTDGLAFRTLSSMRAVMDMAGQWTKEHLKAFDNFKNGTWTSEDMLVVIQPIKLFTATNNSMDTGNGYLKKIPVQHKNSELLLLASYFVGGPLFGSEKMRAIVDFMEETFDENDSLAGIDVIQFHSVVKVGSSELIDINDDMSYKEIKSHLHNSISSGDSQYNQDTVHENSYDDYGILTATPLHHIDVEQLIGSQFRKLISGDMGSGSKTVIRIGKGDGAREVSFDLWYKEFNENIVANIIESYRGTEKEFKNIESIERLLLEEILGSDRYSIDLIHACKVETVENADGTTTKEFNIPLFEAIQSNRTMSLVNSLIKSRVTKQKIRGGTLIQATNFGYTKDLLIRYNTEDGNLIQTRQEFQGTDEEYLKYTEENPANSMAYMEAYMPWYSKSYFEDLLDENGNLDVSKVTDPELLELIGYRVPTEDAYSMIHIKIKGFTPPAMGGVIMLPSEITSITGADFDVDKMFVLMPEFEILEEDFNYVSAFLEFLNKQGNEDLKTTLEYVLRLEIIEEYSEDEDGNPIEFESQEEMENFIEEKIQEEMEKSSIIQRISKESKKKFYKFYEENKSKFYVPKSINKVQYERGLSTMDQSREARNNRILDLAMAKMDNSETAMRALKPGGYTDVRHTARMMEIIKNLSKELIIEFLKLSDEQLKDLTIKDIASLIMKADNNTIDGLYQMTQTSINPLSIGTQLHFLELNMVGKLMVSIFANHNSHHSMMQHTNLELNISEGKSFVLNGLSLSKLNNIKNYLGNYISNNVASYLAAAVDNAKESVLSSLNLTTETADVAALLARLGYESDDVGAFLNQPIIAEALSVLGQNKSMGMSLDTALNTVEKIFYKNIYKDFVLKEEKIIGESSDGNILKEYKYNKRPIYHGKLKQSKFSRESMIEAILESKNLNSMSDTELKSFYLGLLDVLETFKEISIYASALSDVTLIHKSDTLGGGAGPDIANTLATIFDLEDIHLKDEMGEFPIKGISEIINLNIDTKLPNLVVLAQIMESPSPMLLAFYTFGILKTEELLGNYFPHYNENVRRAIKKIREFTKFDNVDAKLMSLIVSDIMVYNASKLEFFGSNFLGEKDNYLARMSFINHFPEYFIKTLEETDNTEITLNPLILRLSKVKANSKSPVDYLSFRNIGALTLDLKTLFGYAWESLLGSDDPTASKMALNLFKYSYFRNGFSFGPGSFMHLATSYLKKSIPGYVENIREISSSELDYSIFIRQFMRNNLHNKKLVPAIESEDLPVFDEDGKFLNEFEISIDAKMDSKDKEKMKFVKEFSDTGGARAYVALKHGKKEVYYQLFGNAPSKDKITGYYVRVYPLGIANQFKEYEYGVQADGVVSSILLNQATLEFESDTMESMDSEFEDDSSEELPEFDNEGTSVSSDPDNGGLSSISKEKESSPSVEKTVAKQVYDGVINSLETSLFDAINAANVENLNKSDIKLAVFTNLKLQEKEIGEPVPENYEQKIGEMIDNIFKAAMKDSKRTGENNDLTDTTPAEKDDADNEICDLK